jgi:hypothetical protein
MNDAQGTAPQHELKRPEHGTPEGRTPEERKPEAPKAAAPKAQSNGAKPADLFEPWRQFRDAYLDFWSKNMVEAVNSEAYAQATGALLDTTLTTSIPFREALEKAMTTALQQLSMPTRGDLVSAAERLTNLEMKLDDLDVKLDRIEQILSSLPGSEDALADSPSPRRRAPRKK